MKEEAKDVAQVPMFEANGSKCVMVKHFPIDKENSYVQYTARMSEQDYKLIVNGNDMQQANFEPGKDKILIQCLDTSGSMAGAPMRSLQQGCVQIGERFFQNKKKPYERFYTIEYNAVIKETLVDNKEQYMHTIQQAKAGGGTNFMIVF